jgi:hypothetical protein
MEQPQIQSQQENKYFTDRMQLLGITDDVNKIGIQQTDPKNPMETITVDLPIFKPHEKGIEIMVYSLSRTWLNYTPEGNRWKKRWSIIRLEQPIRKDDGTEMKYQMPKGAGSFPFFPPSLVEKFEKKTKIQTLFLTEGFFKAFKGHLHGLDIVGLPSITHLMEKGKGTLHQEILDLILKCSVERVVWLTDGDCLDIPTKLKDDAGQPKDLFKRPFNFYNSILQFKQLLNDYDVEKYFMHIDSDNIGGHPKGLDDLLVQYPDKAADIVHDLQSVSKPGQWVQKFNITAGGVTKVRNYFHLGDVTDFYLYHSEKRKELKDQAFIWNGTQYHYDDKENRCIIEVPGETKNYFRVGDYYYKFIQIPNQHKKLERVFVERKKGTIIDDHDKNFLRHVPKYEAFCNVPEHTNFQQVINNCFNVYSPLDFHPDEDECTAEDCPVILQFLKHIFGTTRQRMELNGDKFECSCFDLGMDYMQLLYERPDEKLPILCLVSKENNTGKSTLGNFLRLMLGANVAIVGNQDLAGDFNAHWATKTVVVLDEAKIDKQHVVEKVKMLSTAKKVTMNSKGKNQTEIDCFIKFIMISNHEENFIYAGEEDIRFWIIKVPKIKSELPNIMQNFIDEMPAFLSYLSRRKMTTTKQGRMWFHPQLLKTDALKKVVSYSEPVIVKEIRQNLREMFLDFGMDRILMTRKVIHKEFFAGKYESSYLEKVLNEVLKVDQFHELDPVQKDPETGDPLKIYKTCRYTYPRYESKYINDKPEMVRVDVTDNGRPYVFYRKDFLSAEEMKRTISSQNLFENSIMTVVQSVSDLPTASAVNGVDFSKYIKGSTPAVDDPADDVPF